MLKKFVLLVPVILLITQIYSQDNPYIFPKGINETFAQPFMPLDTNLYVQGQWSYLNNLPAAMMGTNTYYDSLGGRIFICGGLKQNSIPMDTCWWYNIASGSYQVAALLPKGRWGGKLVKVKSSLYLVGSIDSTYQTADGIIYKYSLTQNLWSVADTMPAPLVHESAVSVFKDSLIFVIGGSSNGFSFPNNLVRIYNPELNTWLNSTPFPVNITTAHCEVNNDSIFFVAGGYNAGNLNTVYKGVPVFQNSDTVNIFWEQFGNTPYGFGTYRMAGTHWKVYMLFGPAMYVAQSINSIWGLSYQNGFGVWTNFQPVSDDTSANISTFSAVTGIDSNYFYIFGGYKNPNILNTAKKYSFITPPPIGIHQTSENIPGKFKLYQNYPNPFNPSTKIKFDISENLKNENIFIKVFDVTGRQVYFYALQGLNAGSYEMIFDGKNLTSGVYFFTLSFQNFKETRKMILIK